MVQYRVAFHSFKSVAESLDFLSSPIYLLVSTMLEDTTLNRSETSHHNIFKYVIKMSKHISLYDMFISSISKVCSTVSFR